MATGGLFYSAWLGGTLVTRNMAGVDHRYANTGKWQDASVTAKPGEPVVVGHADDLEDDQMKLVRINGKRYLLARSNGKYTMCDDSCTHRGGSLAGGVLIDGIVQCLWHGSQFDVKTGEVQRGPAKKKIRAYEVKKGKDGKLVAEI
jgi:nitrite reductase/ring-hydroxylating ferredoxin subunit